MSSDAPYDPAPASDPRPPAVKPMVIALAAGGVAVFNTGVAGLMVVTIEDTNTFLVLFTLLALVQLVVAIAAVVIGIKAIRAEHRGGVAATILGVLTGLGAIAGWIIGTFSAMLVLAGPGAFGAGGAWGRPLRIRGRQLHPNLREGSDWTRGARPDPRGLDPATRAALEALWLHDAQKEHASVPAFARISWLLAAVGAPAELVSGAHQAALEEIEHTRLCFALAAGYGDRSHSVEAMPELLLGFGFEGGGERGGRVDPLVLLAVESLGDGCQLEDFNADVAAACAEACTEPVTRSVLETIAVEERSHAEFSWDLLDWLLARDFDRATSNPGSARVAPAIRAALAKLDDYPRPTAVSGDKLELFAAADVDALRAHGRLPDARWAELWDLRLLETQRRVEARLASFESGANLATGPTTGTRAA